MAGITPTANHAGYWLVASDGGIFTFGDASSIGSIPGLGLPLRVFQSEEIECPIVGMVPTTDGGGYFMVASDGGVFTFGDAKFEGSCPGIGGCSGGAVAVMPDASGNGYWLVTATGHVYTFGDAAYYGHRAPKCAGHFGGADDERRRLLDPSGERDSLRLRRCRQSGWATRFGQWF